MYNDGSVLNAEVIADKLSMVASWHYPSLSHQFQDEPRLAEILWFAESRRRQPRGLEGFVHDVIDFAGEKVMPHEFLALPVDQHGRFSAEDVSTVWDRLPAKPTGKPDGADAEKLRAWLTRDRCMNACVLHARERLAQCLIDCVFNLEELFPTSLTNHHNWNRSNNLWRLLPDLPELLLAFMDAHAARTLLTMAQTRVTKIVYEALDYAWECKVLVLLLGDSRFGKTESMNAHCEAYPGRERLIRTPAVGGVRDLLNAIAEALGIEDFQCSLPRLREKIRRVLRHGGLLIAFDESQFLIPSNYSKTTAPARLNFVRTEIVDARVPCLLTATPQAHKQSLKSYADKTKYALEQWLGRVDYTFNCPEEFTEEDMLAVAKVHFPDISEKLLLLIVARAMQSEQFLHAMTAIGRRAKYLAKPAQPTKAHVTRACDEFATGVGADRVAAALRPSGSDAAEQPGEFPSRQHLRQAARTFGSRQPEAIINA